MDSARAFVYDGSQIALAFADLDGPGPASNSLTNRYLWGPAVDQLLADELLDASPGQAADILWAATDHLNTVRDQLSFNPSGNSGTGLTTIANHRDYDSFGNVVSETNAAIDTLFGFTARPFDEHTGQQNNLNRWYDALTGRWVSEDPIQDDYQNSARYAGNGPTNRIDPTGLYEEDVHYYLVKYLFYAKGWRRNGGNIADFSQYVDDTSTDAVKLAKHSLEAPLTNGYIGSRKLIVAVYAHFWGCRPNQAVKRNPLALRLAIAKELQGYQDLEFLSRIKSDQQDRIKDELRHKNMKLGFLLHSYADSWSHEGFTVYHNSAINTREGSLRPNTGHADAPEGGHAPDRPYNDVDKALEAARAIWDLIPDRDAGPRAYAEGPINQQDSLPWTTVENDLRRCMDPKQQNSRLSAFVLPDGEIKRPIPLHVRIIVFRDAIDSRFNGNFTGYDKTRLLRNHNTSFLQAVSELLPPDAAAEVRK